jgi:hypothetical protein
MAGYAAGIGLVYLMLSYQPLYHTDVWGHLSYGRFIVENKALPATEPFLPLCEGVPVVDSAWLSQVIGYALHQRYGNTALQFLFAAAVAATLCLLSIWYHRGSRNAFAAALGLGLFYILNWHQWLIIRPQIAGLVCFATVLVVMHGGWKGWIKLPLAALVFAAWANLHGSFLIGVVWLGIQAAGRAFDLLRRTGQLRAVLHDRVFRHWLLAAELAAAATLVNPYGWRLWSDVLFFGNNPNLADLREWDPLSVRGLPGQAMAATVVLLGVLYRVSPRRVRAGEVVAIVLFGLAAAWSQRMLVWWTPLAAGAVVLHFDAIWRRWRRIPALADDSPRAGKWSVVTIGLIWISFAFTPFGLKVMHNRETPGRSAYFDQTPVGLTEYLNKRPPRGQVFNTYEWGDYLLWAGPRGTSWFVYSHAHLVPNEIWRHYMAVSNASGDWQETLDRYGVNCVVIDKAERGALISRLRDDQVRWRLDYEDGVGVVFNRVQPIE